MSGSQKCNLCGGSRFQLFVTTFDRYHPKQQSFQLWQCQTCGLVVLLPLPNEEELQASYPRRFLNPFLYFQNIKKDNLNRIYTFFHPYSVSWRLKQVEKEIGVGRLLDVGCGNGDFLYEIRQRLWEVVGVETHSLQAQFVRGTLGLKVVKTMADLLPDYRHHFDVITFWHTLGHFLDLHGTLQQARELLHPRGVMLLALPNYASLDFWLYHRFWAALDTPRRLFHFTPKQVRQLLRLNGWQLEMTRTIPFDIYYNCLLSEKILMEYRGKKIHLKFLYYLRSLMVAINAHILSIAGTSSGMLYVVRRRGDGAK